eukprot:6188010-Pleurochrysis_carterae.AAC.4
MPACALMVSHLRGHSAQASRARGLSSFHHIVPCLIRPAAHSPTSHFYHLLSEFPVLPSCVILCAAIRCCAMLFNAVQYSAMQCCAVLCRAIQYEPVLYSALQYHEERCSAVQCGAVWCCASVRSCLLIVLTFLSRCLSLASVNARVHVPPRAWAGVCLHERTFVLERSLDLYMTMHSSIRVQSYERTLSVRVGACMLFSQRMR